MPIKKTDRESIIVESIQLFKIKGYSSTTMSNIGSSCGLIKGSIYHHFKSKEEIGLESLKYIHNYFLESIFSIRDNESLNDKEKLTILMQRLDEYFLKSKGGCLFGNLALEIAQNIEVFKVEIIKYFKEWEDVLTSILESKYNKKARELAKESIASIQGAVMLMNLNSDREIYLNISRKVANLL